MHELKPQSSRDRDQALAAADASKAALDARRPLPRLTETSMRGALELEFVHSSNALHGGTLTLRETKVVLEGIAIDGKSMQEQADAIAERDALQYVSELATLSLHPIERAARMLLVSDEQTGRLLMNLELLRAGYPLVVIHGKDGAVYSAGMNEARSGNFEALTEIVAAAVQHSINRYLDLLNLE